MGAYFFETISNIIHNQIVRDVLMITLGAIINRFITNFSVTNTKTTVKTTALKILSSRITSRIVILFNLLLCIILLIRSVYFDDSVFDRADAMSISLFVAASFSWWNYFLKSLREL